MFVQPILKHATCVAALMCGCASYAQQTQIPFDQIQRGAQLPAKLVASNSNVGTAAVSGSAGGVSDSAAPSFSPAPASELNGAPVNRGPRIVDSRYVWLNSAHLAAAFADIEMSQRCIDEHTCVEANPLMPSSQAGKLGLNFGIVAYTACASYYLKKHRSSLWWLPPLAGISFHAGGVASGISH